MLALLESNAEATDTRVSEHDAVSSEGSVAPETVKLPTMCGKVGSGRHGDDRDQAMLALHMRNCKSLINQAKFRQSMANLLDNSSFQKNGAIVSVRTEATTTGIIFKLKPNSRRGNRFSKLIPWAQFLKAAYGKLKRDTHISLAMDVSRSTAQCMATMVGSVFLAQQCLILGKLIMVARLSRPAFVIRQLKWDETSIWTSANPDNNPEGRTASMWSVMVARQRVVIGWANGNSAFLRLVMPPALLLGGAAQHVYYTLKYHPLCQNVQNLMDMLVSQSFCGVELYESDGAYANERLVAHLLQKNKGVQNNHIVHTKCQNHQSQLINVALLSAVGCNILSRLYGFAVFIRNLGNWLRLKQAVHTWVDSNLEFVTDIVDPDAAEKTSTILRFWNSLIF